jgi:hypothetical protein
MSNGVKNLVEDKRPNSSLGLFDLELISGVIFLFEKNLQRYM